MSKYTTEVRYICENKAGFPESAGFNDIETIINKSWDSIFTKNWSIFKESYRPVLCKKILRHFYTREICAETVGLWQLWMDATLCDIMPYYNQMYESELLKFDVFNNVNVTKNIRKTGNEKIKEDGTNSNTGTTNSSNSTTDTFTNSGTNTSEKTDGYSESNKYSDTPQGGLNDIEGDKYLTNARLISRDDVINQTDKISNSGKTTGSNTLKTAVEESGKTSNSKTSDSTETWIESLTGKNTGDSNTKLLMEFRESFLNIDMMIINDLESLFFTLW